MSSPAIPCDSCGSPIPDSDLETGSAITLLGKRYCPDCKTEAIQSVSLDDLAARPAAAAPAARAPQPKAAPAKAAPKATPPKAPSPPPAPAKPAPPPKAAPAPVEAAPARGERKPTPRRPGAPGAKSASRTPLLIGIGAVVVIAIVVGVVLSRGGSSTPTESGGAKGGPSTGVVPKGPDRDAQAREAYAKVEELSRRAGTSWDLILAAADKAKATCRGTEWEKRLEDLRARAAHEKETEEAARELGPLVDELKGAVATDPEFKRYAELQPKFQLALETASKTGSARRDEIRALQRDYNGKYEKLAEPYYTEINEAALQLTEEKRYDDALRKINTFPPQLRHSGAWMSLEKLKQDIERRKKK
jgi:hypothetical protein